MFHQLIILDMANSSLLGRRLTGKGKGINF